MVVGIHLRGLGWPWLHINDRTPDRSWGLGDIPHSKNRLAHGGGDPFEGVSVALGGY